MKFFTHADYCTKIRGNLFSAAVEVPGLLSPFTFLQKFVLSPGTPFAFKYWWGSVYKLGKGKRRKGEKKKEKKRGQEEKEKRKNGKRRKGEKKKKIKREKKEKKKRRKGEKKKRGKKKKRKEE